MEEAVETPAAPPPPLQVEPGRVAVTQDGEDIQSVPVEQLAAAEAQQYRPATEAEIYAARAGTAGKIIAGTDAIARGFTFGLSDAAQVGISRALWGEKDAESARRQTKMLKEAHPGTALAGEVGGSLAGMLLMPGGAAKGATAAEGLLARAGSRALGAAPRAFAEGAAISVGQQFSEDTLGNHDLVAQKYLSSALKGGVLGALVGGGFAAGGGAIADKLSRAGRGGSTAERGLLTRARGFAEEQAFKGTGAKIKDWQKLGATAEDQAARAQRIGRRMLDEGITTPGASLKDQGARLTKRLGEVTDDLSRLRKTFDKAKVRPSAEVMLDRINKEVVLPLMERPFSEAEQAVLRPQVAEIIERTGGKATFDSFDDLFRLRRALGDKIKAKAFDVIPGTQSQATKEAMKIHKILEGTYEDAAELAAKELGNNTATKYVAKKALFHDLKTAEEIVTKEVARGGANRAISLTDTIAAMGGLGAAAAGHPMALLAPVANKLARTYGNQAVAYTLDRALKLTSVARAAEVFDRKLATSVDAFFTKSANDNAPTRTASRMSPEMTRALRAAVRDPNALTERVADRVGALGLAEEAPNVSRAMTAAIMRAATYVNNRLPAEPLPRGVALGETTPRARGRRAQVEVDNAVRALDTDALLDDIARGRIDRQQIEALRIINPELHAEVQGAIDQYVVENRPRVSRQQQVALSIITGRPLGAMMQPKTIRGFQEAHAQGAKTAEQPDQASAAIKPMGSGGPSRLARDLASGMDRLEAPDAM